MTAATLVAPSEPQSWEEDIENVFNAQKANQYAIGSTTASERKAKLKKLLATVLKYRTEIKQAGYALWYEPMGLIYHKESASVGKLSTLKLYYLTRNRLLFMRRNIKGWRLGLFLSYFFSIIFPAKSLFFLIKGEWASFLTFQKAIFDIK